MGACVVGVGYGEGTMGACGCVVGGGYGEGTMGAGVWWVVGTGF